MGKRVKYTVQQPWPRCINHGCNNPCHNGSSGKGHQKPRSICSRCHLASYKGKPYAPGVRPFRTGVCSNNKSNHLGFSCPMNYEKASWAIGQTQLDHIDGNCYNNTLENSQELCLACHAYKSKINKDYRNKGSSERPPPLPFGD